MTAPLEPTLEANFVFDTPFALEHGGTISPLTLRYAVYGPLNRARDNAVLACHALSGSARVADWWPQIFGGQGLFDTARDCVIGINVIGSCYGTTGPASEDSRTARPFGANFPVVTIGDMVRAQALLLDHLGILRLRAVAGGSIGGMQALQWAVDFPERVERCVSIGATPLSAMGLALNHLQRQAIHHDPSAGLALARAIGMCSYKSAELFAQRFGRAPNRNGEQPGRSLHQRFDVAGYLDYQGTSFVRRFDPNSYLVLSKAMDLFDVDPAAFRRARPRLLLVGISSDWLFPAADVKTLAARFRQAGASCDYVEFRSDHGHDAFLADVPQLAEQLRPWLQDQPPRRCGGIPAERRQLA